MKKITAILFVALSLLLIFSLPALAADAEDKTPGFQNIETKTDVVIEVFAGDTKVNENAQNRYENSDRLEVEYTDATEGSYYGVLLVKGSGVPTKDTPIYYIDQVTAQSTSVNFNVYPILPAGPTDLSLYISSNALDFELIKVPLEYYIYVPYALGDVDGDGQYGIKDALLVLQIGAGKFAEVSDTLKAAADVDGDGVCGVRDALLILQYGAGKISSFPKNK